MHDNPKGYSTYLGLQFIPELVSSWYRYAPFLELHMHDTYSWLPCHVWDKVRTQLPTSAVSIDV